MNNTDLYNARYIIIPKYNGYSTNNELITKCNFPTPNIYKARLAHDNALAYIDNCTCLIRLITECKNILLGVH